MNLFSLAKCCIRRTCGLLWKIRTTIKAVPCRLCGGATQKRAAYDRLFLQCQDCGFIFAGDYPKFLNNRGMGLVGSWGGPESGGEREDFLVRMISRDFGLRLHLLYGTGTTAAFPKLLNDGFDVYGCDISKSVVRYRQRNFGKHRFFHVSRLPTKQHVFDTVIACEVFEHFHKPKAQIECIIKSLRPGGILCGCTNFHLGGDIEDSQKIGYMSLFGHIAYWSERSLAKLLGNYGFGLILFEMVCPGSVKPDPKYGQLFPNKRVFFATNDSHKILYLSKLRDVSPILPIDVSTYIWPESTSH